MDNSFNLRYTESIVRDEVAWSMSSFSTHYCLYTSLPVSFRSSLNIISSIQKRFGIVITIQEFSQCAIVEDLVSLVKSKLV